MKLQNQVCTLEQAKKLKELGVSQDGYFTWAIGICFDENEKEVEFPVLLRPDNGEFDFVSVDSLPDHLETEYGFDTKAECSAFTVAELGVMCHDDHDVYAASVYYSNHLGCWMWQIMEQMHDEFEGNGIPWKVTHSDYGEYDSEAETRAAMLIYCIENNLFTVEEVNKRLTQ